MLVVVYAAPTGRGRRFHTRPATVRRRPNNSHSAPEGILARFQASEQGRIQLPEMLVFPENVCPPNLQAKITAVRTAHQEYRREEERLKAIVMGPPRSDIALDEITYWHNVRIEKAETMVAL